MRTAIYNQYSTNVGLHILEADRNLSDEADLRYACCYAFADYLYDLAADRLTGGDGDDTPGTDLSFKVFSTADSTLAPGITQSINYALNSANNQFIYYLSSIDVTRDDVYVGANYKDNDPSKGWGMQTLTNQMNAAKKNHSDPSKPNYIENYTPVVGINADFFDMSNGRPSSALVMNGTIYNGCNGNFFGILKDGTPIIGGMTEWNAYKDDMQEAVGGSILLIKDGEAVSASGTYYTTPGTRSAVGITRDGKVIFLVVDGRQAPMSVGATVDETAQILLDAGCVIALPENSVWAVSDSSIGSITASGVFTAAANGTVEVQLTVDGEVVGSKTLYVVVPDALKFTRENFAVIYDVPFEVPVQATYQSNKVKINLDDVAIGWEYEENATLDGFTLTTNDNSSIRSMMIAAVLTNNVEYDEEDNPIYIMCTTTISMYYSDESYFDFDDATAGNRTMAWICEVLNATEESDRYYHVDDPSKDMTVEYTFGLDMSTIEIPPQLEEISYMLDGGAGASAWTLLLRLAERVSVLTEVSVSMTVDPSLSVDVSNLKLSSEFFYLKGAVLDEDTNVLTIRFGWIDRESSFQENELAQANPMCILSGLKLTPKSGASWSSENTLAVTSVGNVSYSIYLRASALYSFASQETNQQKFGLIPFVNPDVIVEGNPERGASFSSTYADFEDSYTLDKANRNGWIANDNVLTYWRNNVKLTGVQYLPSYEDSSVKKFYNLDENGVVTGIANGFVTYNGDLYYAIDGQPFTGWTPLMNEYIEKDYYYYFDASGKAVNGEQTIGGYHYVFHICGRAAGSPSSG